MSLSLAVTMYKIVFVLGDDEDGEPPAVEAPDGVCLIRFLLCCCLAFLVLQCDSSHTHFDSLSLS